MRIHTYKLVIRNIFEVAWGSKTVTTSELQSSVRHHVLNRNLPLWPLYIFGLIILCIRTPFAIVHGAIWAEDGTIFLRYARESSPLRALFAPHQGYYSLVPNLCGLLTARIFPLEQAAHICVATELAVEMLLVYMLVQCERIPGFWKKALAVVVIVLSPPTMSIALDTLNAQFYLAVMTGVILISEAERLRFPRILSLLLAGLNGTLSCLFLPFFLWRAWKEGTRSRIAQAAVLSICTLVQLVAVLHLYDRRVIMTAGSLSKASYFAGSVLANGPVHQFLGLRSLIEMCRAVGSPKLQHWQTVWWSTLEVGAVLYMITFCLLLWKQGWVTRALGTVAILTLVLVEVRGGAVNSDLMCGAGPHYFYVFNLLSALALLLVAFNSSKVLSRAMIPLIAAVVLSGLVDLYYSVGHHDRPIWSQEIAKWRADPDYRPRILPNTWPGVRIARTPGDSSGLPFEIYDSTVAGWEER